MGDLSFTYLILWGFQAFTKAPCKPRSPSERHYESLSPMMLAATTSTGMTYLFLRRLHCIYSLRQPYAALYLGFTTSDWCGKPRDCKTSSSLPSSSSPSRLSLVIWYSSSYRHTFYVFDGFPSATQQLNVLRLSHLQIHSSHFLPVLCISNHNKQVSYY